MKVLVINAGSSSLKYQLIDMTTEKFLCKGNVECIGQEGSFVTHEVADKKDDVVIKRVVNNHTDAFNLVMECLLDNQHGVIKDVNEISAIGHRFVNAGEVFMDSIYLDDKALEKLETIIPMAPLHNPSHIACIKSCKAILPNVPNVIVFDTGFHATMPKKAALYGIAYEDYEKYKFRRYGAHGTSHRFVSNVAREYLQERNLPNGNIVTCHLGNGSSISAVKEGKCIDTSMGMTPLAGVMMGTRCGDMDPALVEMLATAKNMSMKEITNYLNKKCGFLGVSGVSSDARALCNAAEQGNERAKLTLDMFAYQVKKYIGSYAASMNGLDCVVFTGGIGENSKDIREAVMKDMQYFGIDFDFDFNKNAPRQPIVELTKPNSKVKVLAIKTNEELVIARDTMDIVQNLKK